MTTHRVVKELSISSSFSAGKGPELLAVIRNESTGREIVVVKRGGPVHISEVVPGAVRSLLESGLSFNGSHLAHAWGCGEEYDRLYRIIHEGDGEEQQQAFVDWNGLHEQLRLATLEARSA